MALDDGGGDGEAEAGPPLLQLGGEEGFGDAVEILMGDAAAAIPQSVLTIRSKQTRLRST